MQKTASYINTLGFNKILCLGVGIPKLWFNKILADDVTGIDKYDKSLYPRLWSSPTKGIKKTTKKSDFDAVIINDSKHYKDLEKLFKLAEIKVKEGGKILFTHSIPDNLSLVSDKYKPYQNWCGNVYEFILNIKAKGGYKIESFEFDNGLTILQKDDTIEAVDLTVEPFEDWYFNRKSLMNIK